MKNLPICFLSAILLLALAACGGQEQSGNVSQPPANSASPVDGQAETDSKILIAYFSVPGRRDSA